MTTDKERLKNCMSLSDGNWANYHNYKGLLFMYIDSDGAVQQRHYATQEELDRKNPNLKGESSLVVNLESGEMN